jgi:hypothetical protein
LLPQCDPTLRARLARKHWPAGMCFTAEQQALIERGWPHLRVLVDGDPRDRRAAALADEVLAAIDPVLPIYWPRDAARHFVCKVAQVKPRAVTVSEVDAILEHFVGRIVGYRFIVEDALLLCEAFLGADEVAERIVARLERTTVKEWASTNPHDKLITIISLLEPLLLRASKGTAAGLTARLRELEGWDGKLPSERFRMLIESDLPLDAEKRGFVYDVPVQTVNWVDLPRYLEHEFASWLLDPQHLWIAGPGIVDEKRHLEPMRRMPQWRVRAACEELGIIKHPIIARMMTILVGCKAAGGMPEAWLAAHPELGGAVPAPRKAKPKAKSKKAQEKELDDAVAALFERLVADVARVRRKPKEVKKVITAAVHELIELRAGAGDPTPEFHIGHILFVDGWGDDDRPPLMELDPTEEEADRWGKYVDDATDT